MNAGDWIVLLVLAVILLLIFRFRKAGKKSCSGDCAHCGQVDWEKIRCEIREDRQNKERKQDHS